MGAVLIPDLAQQAYDGLAAHYDAMTSGYGHDRWLDAVEGIAVEQGLGGRKLLDVACGTGKSFLPMLERGYEVTACDLSPEMVACAREKAGGAAELFVADMRDLPEVGAFDLITCLDDAVNYLTSPGELVAALRGFERNLAPGGLAIFDTNTLATYRTAFADDAVFERDGAVFCMRGDASEETGPGTTASAWIDVFVPEGEGLYRRVRTRHLQRHHPRAEVVRAVDEAGLELTAVLGQMTGVRLSDEPDEERDTKTLYVTRKPLDREEMREGVILC